MKRQDWCRSAAGLAVAWKDPDEIKSLWAVAETYQPKMASAERKNTGWVGKRLPEKSGLGQRKRRLTVRDALRMRAMWMKRRTKTHKDTDNFRQWR
jgi:hypothetical protein